MISGSTADMSYILEALKKSQRQRELGSVPRLTTEQVPLRRPGAAGMPWWIAGVALLSAGAAVFLYDTFGRHLPRADGAAPVATAQHAPAPSAASVATGTKVESPRVVQTSGPQAQPVPPVTNNSAAAAADEPAAPLAETAAAAPGFAPPADDEVTHYPAEVAAADDVSVDAEPQVPARDGTLANAASMERTPAAPVVASAQPLPLLSQLPFEAQSSIPPVSLNVHVYSHNPAERFVFLNMQKYREGERSREGVLIEEITPDGAILRYGQQRFRLAY